jgi:DNA-binding HxlR family transcriptional regulator
MTRTFKKVGYIQKSEHGDGIPRSCTAEEAAEALRLLEGKWKMLIIFRLFETPILRFSELHRQVPGVTQKMLIQQLRDLEGVGIVGRTVYPEVPPKVEYFLTEVGKGLYPVLDELLKWWKSFSNNTMASEGR